MLSHRGLSSACLPVTPSGPGLFAWCAGMDLNHQSCFSTGFTVRPATGYGLPTHILLFLQFIFWHTGKESNLILLVWSQFGRHDLRCLVHFLTFTYTSLIPGRRGGTRTPSYVVPGHAVSQLTYSPILSGQHRPCSRIHMGCRRGFEPPTTRATSGRSPN